MKGMITAVEMAQSEGIEPEAFRRALRAANLRWHSHNERWVAHIDSMEHHDMQRVLSTLSARPVTPAPLAGKEKRDEAWIIDLCDKFLGKQAIRQHRFPFLRGDVGPSGRKVRLPVDAFYPDLNLVIEYHEKQHTSSVPHFDKRTTVSGVGRGEQRRLYDERRKEVLPKNGLRLVILAHSEFNCTGAGRLVRDHSAEVIIAERLKGL